MGIKSIGVLTSGGDAPGMNPCIRAVVRASLFYGLKAYGIENGYKGLIEGQESIREMDYRSVSEKLNRGGTFLRTSRCLEFKTEEGISHAIENIKKSGIDAIVALGGDGTFRGALDLAKHGIPVIGIPATIDNDIVSSDYSLGFDTALTTVCEAVDKLRDTCFSHNRCSVVEVMGNKAGHIALNVAVATGAEAIIIPERDFDFDVQIVNRIKEAVAKGKPHFIVILVEGILKADVLAARIEKMTGTETRATVLGHIQRGGKPSVYDRVTASRMGVKAVELLRSGIKNRVVVMKNGELVDFDIEESLKMTKTISEEYISLVDILTK